MPSSKPPARGSELDVSGRLRRGPRPTRDKPWVPQHRGLCAFGRTHGISPHRYLIARLKQILERDSGEA
jgi:hypothetical protein